MATPNPILASAPGRCGIIGNPTDMYGGSVLSCSIAPRAYALVEPADRLTLVSLGQPWWSVAGKI